MWLFIMTIVIKNILYCKSLYVNTSYLQIHDNHYNNLLSNTFNWLKFSLFIARGTLSEVTYLKCYKMLSDHRSTRN